MYPQLKLENQLCFRLYTASRLVAQAYTPFFEPLGITYLQYLVLMVLWEQDNQLVCKIAHRLVLESNTITPLLQRMERSGLVIRTKGIADGRQTLVSLTKKGRLLEELAKDIPKRMAQCWKGDPLSMEQLNQLINMLDTMIKGYSPEVNKERKEKKKIKK